MLIEYDQLIMCCKDVYKVTNITKYRSFQYHLMFRALSTNIHLKHWGMRDNDLCSFCNLHRETLSHLFVMCPKVQPLWLSFENWITIFSTNHINFSIDTVLCNKLIDNLAHLFNFLCLLLKQYIYKQRCLGKPLAFISYKTLVNSIRNIEKFIAIKNGKVLKHNKKWFIQGQDIAPTSNIDDYVIEYLNML